MYPNPIAWIGCNVGCSGSVLPSGQSVSEVLHPFCQIRHMPTLFSGAVFNGINLPIFSWRQFLIESGVKAFIWINTERLIVKIEKLINAIPNVPLGSYYRHGLSGITSGRDRTT